MIRLESLKSLAELSCLAVHVLLEVGKKALDTGGVLPPSASPSDEEARRLFLEGLRGCKRQARGFRRFAEAAELALQVRLLPEGASRRAVVHGARNRRAPARAAREAQLEMQAMDGNRSGPACRMWPPAV